MSEEEFGSFEFLKFKYRRENKIIQSFCRLGSPQEIRFPLFSFKKFRRTEKSTFESCKIF